MDEGNQIGFGSEEIEASIYKDIQKTVFECQSEIEKQNEEFSQTILLSGGT
jgi:hypothetical protein